MSRKRDRSRVLGHATQLIIRLHPCIYCPIWYHPHCEYASLDRKLGGMAQGESFLGRKCLIGKKIKKELDKPEGISHTKMV